MTRTKSRSKTAHERRGVTPIIAVVILLLITVALAGTAWTYLSGYVGTQTQKTFTIVTNGAYCENGVIKVYVVNTGYQVKLADEDFTLRELNAAPIPLDAAPTDTNPAGVQDNVDLAPGAAAKLIDWNCNNPGTGCPTGFHALDLATPSTKRSERILCP